MTTACTLPTRGVDGDPDFRPMAAEAGPSRSSASGPGSPAGAGRRPCSSDDLQAAVNRHLPTVCSIVGPTRMGPRSNSPERPSRPTAPASTPRTGTDVQPARVLRGSFRKPMPVSASRIGSAGTSKTDLIWRRAARSPEPSTTELSQPGNSHGLLPTGGRFHTGS